MATTTAARPLATYCSAQTTPPLPMTAIRKPAIAIDRQVRTGGSFSPTREAAAVRITPAAAQRRPASSATGIDSSETRIAR